MTAARRDGHSTEFGLWVREQPALASELGFIATNLDFIWHNYRTGQWMLMEEKRCMKQIPPWQARLYQMVDVCCKVAGTNYCGFHRLVFEHHSPTDGQMWLDGKLLTESELVEFLRTFRR